MAKTHSFAVTGPTRVLARIDAAAQRLGTFCVPSQAADYEVASSLVCDTQEQVQRFVALFAGDARTAIRVVNAEQKNPTACAMMNIAFMRGNQLGTARHGDNAFQITHILVIGIENGNGIQPVQPAAYYSAFGVKEYAI